MPQKLESIAGMAAPVIQVHDTEGIASAVLVDVSYSPGDEQTRVKTQSSGGLLRVSTISELVADTPGVRFENSGDRASAVDTIRERQHISTVMEHASAIGQEKAAVRGFLVGLHLFGEPVLVPSCPSISWTGDSAPSPAADGPVSVPELLSVQDRLVNAETRRQVAQAHLATRTSLYRWCQEFRRDGLVGLIHGTQGQSRYARDPRAHAIATFVYAIAEERHHLDAAVTMTEFVRICRTRYDTDTSIAQDDETFTIPVRHLVRFYALNAHRAYALGRRLSQRRTRQLSRKSSPRAMIHETVPFAAIQLDATPLDSYALDEFGNRVKTPYVLGAVDVASGGFCDAVVLPGQPTSSDVVEFIVHLMMRVAIDGHRGVINLDRLHTIVLGSVMTDRGSSMIAGEVTQLLADLGIDLIVAAAGRGDQKGAIESMLGKLNTACSGLPGHHGPTQREGRPFSPGGGYLTLSIWQAYVRAWGMEVYNERPRKSLRAMGFKIDMSPSMYIAAFNEVIPVPTQPLDLDVIKSKLLHRAGTLTAQGIQFQGYTFVLPPGQPKLDLCPSTRSSTGHAVVVYGARRGPEFVIVEARSRDGVRINHLLLRSDVLAYELGTAATELAILGIDPTYASKESVAFKEQAEATTVRQRAIATQLQQRPAKAEPAKTKQLAEVRTSVATAASEDHRLPPHLRSAEAAQDEAESFRRRLEGKEESGS